MESNNDSNSSTNINYNHSQPNQQFYSPSTTFEPLNDTQADKEDSRTGYSSVLDRGRPSPRPSILSVDLITSQPLEQPQYSNRELNPTDNNNVMSREWSQDSRRIEEGSSNNNNGSGLEETKRSSFFGLPESTGVGGGGGDERLGSERDYNQYRNELQDGPITTSPIQGRPSSFYGLEGSTQPLPIQQQRSSNPNFHPPPLVTNFSGEPSNSFPESSSGFSREPSKGPRYHNAPYAASRAASLYAISTNSPLDSSTPLPLLDHSHLQPGVLASLLSHEKTLDLYRANAKKTNDPDVQFEFCTFVMEVVGEMEAAESLLIEQGGGGQDGIGGNSQAKSKQVELVGESVALLNKLANRGHVKSQYFLADCYTQGVGTAKGKREYEKAYPLFVLAGKHGHIDACFRAAQCCENGWGCKKDFSKAVTFLRRAAALTHPGAMHRLGIAELNGELGLTKRPREGVKWLKRSAEIADQVDPPQPQSLHELAILHEKGIENVVFKDEEYAAELLARAAELQYAPSAFKLGECYEYGKMGCPQDSALSIHYYNIAAQQDHREACFALTAWYLVGSPGVLPQSDTEAYLWARKAADMGLAKAEYAVGYFTEVGIGTPKDSRDSIEWFKKAAEHGDKRAKDRLRLAGSTQHFNQYNTQAPAQPIQHPRTQTPPITVDPYAQFYEASTAQTSGPQQTRQRPVQSYPITRTQRRMAKEAPEVVRPHSIDRHTLETFESQQFSQQQQQQQQQQQIQQQQQFQQGPQSYQGGHPIRPPPSRRQRSHSQPDPVDSSRLSQNLNRNSGGGQRYPILSVDERNNDKYTQQGANNQQLYGQSNSNYSSNYQDEIQQFQPLPQDNPSYSRLSRSENQANSSPSFLSNNNVNLDNYGRPLPEGREINSGQQFRPIQPDQIRMPNRRGGEDSLRMGGSGEGDKRVLQRGKKGGSEEKDCVVM